MTQILNSKSLNHSCKLCESIGGELITSNSLYRVVHIFNPDYVGYICLIMNCHVKEMTDLTNSDSQNVLTALLTIERVLLEQLKPDKINLASLGNMVPHLHWHIIPRYKEDRHFPNSIWGEVTNQYYIANNIDYSLLYNALKLALNPI